MAKRVKKNGGKALNYFLLPKAYSKRGKKANLGDEEDDYYVVPLIFGRLAQPKSTSYKSRRSSQESDCAEVMVSPREVRTMVK